MYVDSMSSDPIGQCSMSIDPIDLQIYHRLNKDSIDLHLIDLEVKYQCLEIR